jgi:hypothetical protein
MLKRAFTWKTVVRTAGLLAVLLTIGLVAAGCKHENDSPSKPGTLAENATKAEAVAKLDAIIAYCNAHSGTVNDAIKASATEGKEDVSAMTDTQWNTMKTAYIPVINQLINNLE